MGSENVSKEGDRYNEKLWTYAVKDQGRGSPLGLLSTQPETIPA